MDKISGTVKKWSLVALGGRSIQCKYYQILLGQTCEWLLWRVGRFIAVVFKTGLTLVS